MRLRPKLRRQTPLASTMPDAANSGQELDAHVEAFSQAIDDCLELYRSSGEAWQHSLKGQLAAEAEPPQALMQDLARGLLVKLFLTMVQADRRFTTPERRLAQVLLEKLWGRVPVRRGRRGAV